MKNLKSSQASNAVYYLIGREGRYGIPASDLQIATGYSQAHINRILHALMMSGAVTRVECYPETGRPHYIYKDNDPKWWRLNRRRLSRDYAILRLARGLPLFDLVGSARDMEGRND